MKNLLLALLLLCCIYGCKKKDPAVLPVAPAPGTVTTLIKGIISPADAVSTIVITDQGKTDHNVTPDANGAFSIKGLPAGTYTINYSVTLAYVPQSGTTFTLTAGQTLDLGKLVFAPGTGILEGSTAPAGAASKVTVTNAATKISYSAVPDAVTGKYKFSTLPGGIYKISYTAVAPSIAPADTSATVGINQDIVLPLVVFKTLGVTGTISGMISPSGSANVYLFNPAGGYGVTVIPNQGKFVSPDLLPGTYVISFPAGGFYQSPSSQTVTLAPGQSLDLGTINIPKGLYLIPCTVNGTDVIIGYAAANISFNGSALVISAENSPGGLPADKTNSAHINMALYGITGPGTYVLQGTSTSYMSYALGSPYNPSKWSMAGGGTATIIITAIDPVKRVITGTFSATLKPGSNASGDLIITNGVINVTY